MDFVNARRAAGGAGGSGFGCGIGSGGRAAAVPVVGAPPGVHSREPKASATAASGALAGTATVLRAHDGAVGTEDPKTL